MQGAEVRGPGYSGTRVVKDAETWLANSLATILAGLAIAAGVIGLLVGFGRLGNGVNPFQDGMIWMVGGIILGLAANVFRREHHVVDNSELMPGRPYAGEGRPMGRTTYREMDDREVRRERPAADAPREQRGAYRRVDDPETRESYREEPEDYGRGR